METLMVNLSVYGIYLDDKFLAANTYGGYIMPYHDQKLKVKIDKDYYMEVPSCFVISVNKNRLMRLNFIRFAMNLVIFSVIINAMIKRKSANSP